MLKIWIAGVLAVEGVVVSETARAHHVEKQEAADLEFRRRHVEHAALAGGQGNIPVQQPGLEIFGIFWVGPSSEAEPVEKASSEWRHDGEGRSSYGARERGGLPPWVADPESSPPR